MDFAYLNEKCISLKIYLSHIMSLKTFRLNPKKSEKPSLKILKGVTSQKPCKNSQFQVQNLQSDKILLRNQNFYVFQQLFFVQAMMYRIRGIKDFISLKNEECTCFGSILQVEDKFLVNQKSYKIANSQVNNSNKIKHKDHSFFKKGFKKSLKKHFMPLFHHDKTPRRIDANGNQSDVNTQNPLSRHKDIRNVCYQQEKPDTFNQKTFTMNEEHIDELQSIPKKQFLQLQTANKVHQSSFKTLPSFSSTSSRYIFFNPIVQSPRFIEIQYESPAPIAILQNINKQQKMSQPPISIRSLQKSILNYDLNPNYSQILIKQEDDKDLRKCKSSKELLSDFPINQMRKTNSDNEAPNKLKSRLFQQKFKLRRMDQVPQIFSQNDQQQEKVSDSDVESVVLGRWNDYSIMVDQIDHNISSISTVQKSTQGKVIRVNSQKTDFDFGRNCNHETSSHFL